MKTLILLCLLNLNHASIQKVTNSRQGIITRKAYKKRFPRLQCCTYKGRLEKTEDLETMSEFRRLFATKSQSGKCVD
jgi:hypothetical protein